MTFLNSIPPATFQFLAGRKFVPFQSEVTRKYDSHFSQHLLRLVGSSLSRIGRGRRLLRPGSWRNLRGMHVSVEEMVW